MNIHRKMRLPCDNPYQGTAETSGISAAPSFSSLKASRLGQILLLMNRNASPGVRDHSTPGNGSIRIFDQETPTNP